jgi:hypothetical protein
MAESLHQLKGLFYRILIPLFVKWVHSIHHTATEIGRTIKIPLKELAKRHFLLLFSFIFLEYKKPHDPKETEHRDGVQSKCAFIYFSFHERNSFSATKNLLKFTVHFLCGGEI